LEYAEGKENVKNWEVYFRKPQGVRISGRISFSHEDNIENENTEYR
jgi:hypothetical protein